MTFWEYDNNTIFTKKSAALKVRAKLVACHLAWIVRVASRARRLPQLVAQFLCPQRDRPAGKGCKAFHHRTSGTVRDPIERNHDVKRPSHMSQKANAVQQVMVVPGGQNDRAVIWHAIGAHRIKSPTEAKQLDAEARYGACLVGEAVGSDYAFLRTPRVVKIGPVTASTMSASSASPTTTGSHRLAPAQIPMANSMLTL